MKQFVMNVEPLLVREVDKIVKSEKLYSSRNDFVRDAIRSKVLEYRKLKIRRVLKEVAKKAVERGWNGELPTKEQRDEWAKEALKKDGFLVD
ncbi:hypothetical protein HZB89_01105 [archaeon]|nr:hypothetical protein [archaeon]